MLLFSLWTVLWSHGAGCPRSWMPSAGKCSLCRRPSSSVTSSLNFLACSHLRGLDGITQLDGSGISQNSFPYVGPSSRGSQETLCMSFRWLNRSRIHIHFTLRRAMQEHGAPWPVSCHLSVELLFTLSSSETSSNSSSHWILLRFLQFLGHIAV